MRRWIAGLDPRAALPIAVVCNILVLLLGADWGPETWSGAPCVSRLFLQPWGPSPHHLTLRV